MKRGREASICSEGVRHHSHSWIAAAAGQHVAAGRPAAVGAAHEAVDAAGAAASCARLNLASAAACSAASAAASASPTACRGGGGKGWGVGAGKQVTAAEGAVQVSNAGAACKLPASLTQPSSCCTAAPLTNACLACAGHNHARGAAQHPAAGKRTAASAARSALDCFSSAAVRADLGVEGGVASGSSAISWSSVAVGRPALQLLSTAGGGGGGVGVAAASPAGQRRAHGDVLRMSAALAERSAAAPFKRGTLTCDRLQALLLQQRQAALQHVAGGSVQNLGRASLHRRRHGV